MFGTKANPTTQGALCNARHRHTIRSRLRSGGNQPQAPARRRPVSLTQISPVDLHQTSCRSIQTLLSTTHNNVRKNADALTLS